MSSPEVLNITANNSGLVLPEGYELALVKQDEVIATGTEVSERAFEVIGDEFISKFNQIMGARKTPTATEGAA